RSGLLQFVMAAGLAGAMAGGLATTGCSSPAPKTTGERNALSDEVQAVLDTAQSKDPSLRDLLNRSYGYAIYPSIGKGGMVVGGAYGRGEVFEQGRLIGYSDLTQATIGLQLGGQKYAEIVAFEDKAALDRFRNGNLKFAAEASAVALKSGAAA